LFSFREGHVKDVDGNAEGGESTDAGLLLEVGLEVEAFVAGSNDLVFVSDPSNN